MPEPGDTRDLLLSRLADEFAARYRAGERPRVQEYLDRHPELADDIRDLFPAVIEIERGKEDQQQGGDVPDSPASPAPQRFGDYRIIREVGKGGMGVVYEAEQVSLGRHVALKVLPRRLLTDARTKQRFEREARVAARLHHTNIVPVFGTGETDGVPYYAMQFIHGTGLNVVIGELARMGLGAAFPGGPPPAADRDSSAVARSLATGVYQPGAGDASTSAAHQRCNPSAAAARPAESSSANSAVTLPGRDGGSGGNSRRVTYWRSVARIGVQVADALEHAHRQGIQHRDIKPSNLLLDTHGTVWVTDFGVARADDQQNLTDTGDVPGTLRYMPPEAFEGKTDARGDVYSLGLTLYELLALRPAFGGKERAHLLRQVATERPARLDRLNRRIPRDLVTIVHKAAEQNPAHRYRTAGELAADLQRFIDDEPILARRVSPAERVLRWRRRNPAVAGLLAAVALLLVGVTAVSMVSAVRIAGARDEATRNAREAREAEGNEGVQRKLAEARAVESHQRLIRLHVANGLHVARLLDDGDLLGALPWLADALALDQGDGPREERHRTRIAAVLAQSPRLTQLWDHGHEVEDAAFSPDGRRVVTAGRDNAARVWDAAAGGAVTPPLRHAHLVWKAAFSPDGRRVVTASQDRTARVWDAGNGEPVTPPLPHDEPVVDASFSPDGRLVVTAGTDSAARVWDAATGRPRTPPLRHESWLYTASFSPDGRFVVTASNDRTARVWDAATGRPAAPPLKHAGEVRSAAFSPDGRLVVTACEDRAARVWDAATGRQVGPALEHGDRVYRAAFSPDGRYVSTCSYDTTARVWLAATGRAVGRPLQHRNLVRSAAFSPDGRYVVTASNDHTARVWEAATGEPVTPPLRHNFLLTSAAFSPDGGRVVTSSADWTVRVWDIAGRGSAPLTLRHHQNVTCSAFSPDGRLLVTAGEDGTARVWSATSGQPVAGPLRHGVAVLSACFSPDGRRVVTGGQDHDARVWEAATGRELIPPLRHQGRVVQATFSPDGNRVLTASADHSARLWDAHTGAPLGPRMEHREQLHTATFSPDGRGVLTASSDGTARVWDAATGEPRTPPLGHQGAVEAAAFSPDGRRVVTASADYTARVWDAETGTPVTAPLRHGAGVAAVSFSPDGRRVVTGSRQGTARVWDADTGAPATPPLKNGMGLIRVGFTPDGRRVVTGGGGDYTARVWGAGTGESLGPPLRHRGWVQHLAFSSDGRRLATSCYDGTARVWDLPEPDPRPLEDLVLLAQVLSGKCVDARDGLVEVEPAAQRRALDELRSRYPADFADAPARALAWHQREAEACSREDNGPAAVFHLRHSGWWWVFTRTPPP